MSPENEIVLQMNAREKCSFWNGVCVWPKTNQTRKCLSDTNIDYLKWISLSDEIERERERDSEAAKRPWRKRAENMFSKWANIHHTLFTTYITAVFLGCYTVSSFVSLAMVRRKRPNVKWQYDKAKNQILSLNKFSRLPFPNKMVFNTLVIVFDNSSVCRHNSKIPLVKLGMLFGSR